MANKQAIAGMLAKALDRNPEMNQSTLADALGIKQSTVNKWVVGKNMPARDRWHEVERALGLKRGSIAKAYASPTVDRLESIDDRVARMERELAEIRDMLRMLVGHLRPSKQDGE